VFKHVLLSSNLLLALSGVFTLAACASRTDGICGNAAFGYQLSPAHPTAEAVTLLAVRANGAAVLRSTESGRRLVLRPGRTYFDPQFSTSTVTVNKTDPVRGSAEITEQLVP
jgi:hypothetical protein